MKTTTKLTVGGALLVALLATSCKSDNVFDEDKYQQIIDIESPVDSVDAHHTWKLTTSRVIVLNADAGSGIEQALVLTANPVTDPSAEVIAQCTISDGQRKSVLAVFPSTTTTLYAALRDSQNRYTVTTFVPTQTAVHFTEPIAVNQTLSAQAALSPQTFTYCFEEELPQPGDYDYNDVVLRISQEAVSDTTVDIHVTLAAVGAEGQLGGAIRLVGVRYADVDSVVTTGGKTFNDDLPATLAYYFEGAGTLMEGRNGEAVINLFEDAHWAVGDRLDPYYGQILRKHYNVSKRVSSDYLTIPPRTMTYRVYFKRSDLVADFSLDKLDPFILNDYNGGKWEVHTYDYRNAQTLNEYNLSANLKALPWALAIPYSGFHYPLEGVNMGFITKIDGEDVQMGAAYVYPQHSFAEWVRDHTADLDWYLSQYASGSELVW